MPGGGGHRGQGVGVVAESGGRVRLGQELLLEMILAGDMELNGNTDSVSALKSI